MSTSTDTPTVPTLTFSRCPMRGQHVARFPQGQIVLTRILSRETGPRGGRRWDYEIEAAFHGLRETLDYDNPKFVGAKDRAKDLLASYFEDHADLAADPEGSRHRFIFGTFNDDTEWDF